MFRLNRLEEVYITTGRTISLFTLCFVVVSMGIFAMFILLDRTFVQFGDAYRQGYFWIAEIKHNLESFFSGDGYPVWSWSRGTGMELSYVTDPFNLLAALFPWAHLELGYTFALVAKMYLAGLAFIAFGREVKLSQFKCLIGGVFYSFCTWTVNISLMQARFVIIIALFPILFMAIERIYKGKSPLLFMLTVGYVIIENSYLAYMAGIVSVIYIFIRYFAYAEKFSMPDYVKRIGSFIAYGLVGILVSSIVLVQRFLRVQAASTESSDAGIDLLYSSSFYQSLGKHIISEGLVDGYTYIGVPIFVIMLLAVAFRKINIRNTSVLMVLIMFGMMLVPFFSSMFNGFSYNSGRWYYMIPFFCIWAAVSNLNVDRLKEKGNIIAMTAGLGAIAVSTAGFWFIGIISLDINALAFIGVNIIGGAAILICIAFGRNRMRRRTLQLAVLIITCGTLVISWNGSLYGNMGKFAHDGDMYKQLKSSTQRVASRIDDDDFYRVDQVDWINVNQEMKMPANENLWWQSKSIYIYDSKLPETITDLNRLVGNSYGYSKRVYMLSNDNRAGLDYIYGVRYFLGDDKKHDRTGADDYAGYGFEYAGNIDGVNIYKNKYDVGLGFAYSKCIRRSEFEKLTPLEREQALLQAAVIPDADMSRISIGELKAEDIKTDVKEVKFEITDTDGVEFDGSLLKAVKEEASFSLKVEDAPAGQLIVSFDNFIKGTGPVSDSFKFECENERLKETADNEQTNQSIYNVRDYNLNMGCYEGYSGKIRVTLDSEGTYNLDRIRISSMNMELYDAYAKERSRQLMEVESCDDTTVKGTVDLKDEGFLFISITKPDNWNAYVDGKKADKISGTNIAFMGIEVPAGKHSIELRYDNRVEKIGMMASFAGLIIGIAVSLILRRKSK